MVEPEIERRILDVYRELLERDQRIPSSSQIANCIGGLTRKAVWLTLRKYEVKVGPIGRHRKMTAQEIADAHARLIEEEITLTALSASYGVSRQGMVNSIISVFGALPNRDSVIVESKPQPPTRKCLRCGKTGLTSWRCAKCSKYVESLGSGIGY